MMPTALATRTARASTGAELPPMILSFSASYLAKRLCATVVPASHKEPHPEVMTNAIPSQPWR
eukprot:scaffold1945_cov395-Prasinococcus_capsulatus_cf.AAC.9